MTAGSLHTPTRPLQAILAVLAVLAALAPPAVLAQDRPRRSVAFTFDDLPVTRSLSPDDERAITDGLLAQLREEGIPAIGFVNERKLGNPPESARVALLEAWLNAGHELGNHTYSHMRLHDARLEDWQRDVLLGERVTQRLLRERGRRARWLRHPTLSTGSSLAIKDSSERFLSAHGYAVAPVTIDNDEYLFALAYDRARESGDTAMLRRIGPAYVRYMEEIFEHFERLSRDLLGREPAQTLLLHANALNARHTADLAAMLRRRGYHFVTFDQAMSDTAYALPDRYIGARGPSWLERWAVTRGVRPGRPPEIPEWVRQYNGVTGNR